MGKTTIHSFNSSLDYQALLSDVDEELHAAEK